MYFDIDAHKDCFKTNENEAYFWHGRTNGCGGQNNAMEIAAENNGRTLEMCMLDNRAKLEQSGVEFLVRPNGTVEIFYGSNQEESTKFWEDCSKAFAEQSSGNVHVIEGSDLRPNGQLEKDYPSVYNRIEHPALEQNQHVDGITKIDPYTRNQTGYETFDTHNRLSDVSNEESFKNGAQTVVSEKGGGARAPNSSNNNVKCGEKTPPKKDEQQKKTSPNQNGETPDQTTNQTHNRTEPNRMGENAKTATPDNAQNNGVIKNSTDSAVSDEARKAAEKATEAATEAAENSVNKLGEAVKNTTGIYI